MVLPVFVVIVSYDPKAFEGRSPACFHNVQILTAIIVQNYVKLFELVSQLGKSNRFGKLVLKFEES